MRWTLFHKNISILLVSILFTLYFVSHTPSAFATDYLNCSCQKNNLNTFLCEDIQHAIGQPPVVHSCANPDDQCKQTLNSNEYYQNNGDLFAMVKCVPAQLTSKNNNVDCSCTHPNDASANNNGFTCTGQKGNYQIYCSQSSQACVPGTTNSVNMSDGVTMVNGSNADYDTNFKGKTAKGITCQNESQIKASQKIACRCTSPDLYSANSNGFTCDGMGSNDDGKPYSIFCSDSDQACVTGADKSIFLNNENGLVMVRGNNKDFDNNFKGHTATGVSCEKKVKKPDPPPPSPPCVAGGWVAGQCSSFVTALGNLDTDTSGFSLRLFSILLSFSGGIALLLIIRAGYNLITSQGNPEQVKNGRDQLIAAIVGLTFLIFSLVILELIGYDILRIPGFGSGTVAGGGTCTVGGNQCTTGYTCNYVGSQGQCVKQTVGTPCDPNLGSTTQCPNGQTCKYNGSSGTCQ